MFDQTTLAAVRDHARDLNVELAALLAVLEVESAGDTYAVVDGKREPLIRFEGHYFDRRLTGSKREQARREGLAHPSAGGVKNPRNQAGRWKLLARAMKIDRRAALESISIGLGQVMVAHWKWLGYASPEAMVEVARKNAAGQIELMIRYIEKAGLVGAIRRKDWAAFARGYNGPAFARYGYHTKMARAYARHSGSTGTSTADGMLRMGSRGARVRELQALLVRAGYALTVDGDYGPATRKAIEAFQAEKGLVVDGIAGPQTVRALDRFRQGDEDRPGATLITEVPEVRTGLGVAGGATGVEVARQAAEDAAFQFGSIEGFGWVSASLSLVALVLAIGGIVWAARGWLRAQRTEEVPQ